jgi:hypothetical protein
LFDPVALLQRAGQIHEARHPTLGLIRYGELVIADSEIINKCKSKADRNAMSIYLMLKKAYTNLPDYTPETISEFNCSFPMLEASELIKFLNEQPGFFVNQIANWIKHNSDAESIGLVLSTFPQFNFSSLRELTVFRFTYLVAWARLHQVKVR